MDNQNNKSIRIRLVLTMFLTAAAYMINYCISLVLVPFISTHLGDDAYGFITLATNFSSYAVILTTALNSYATRFISVEYIKGNRENANRYYSSVFIGDAIIVAALLIVFGVITVFLDHLIKIPDPLINDVKLLFALVFVNFAFLTMATAASSSAQITNHLDLIGVFKGLASIMQAVCMYVLFKFLGVSLWIVGAGYAVAGLVIYFTSEWMHSHYIGDLAVKRSSFSIKAVKELVVNGIWNSISSLGNTLNTGLDLLISNLMLNAVKMTQISYAKTIGVIFQTLYALMSYPFQPLFLDYYSKGDKKGLVKELKFSMKTVGLISELAFAGILALGLSYIKLWIPNMEHETIYILTVFTVASSLGEGVVCPLYYVYTLTIKNKIPCIVTIFGGVLNILGMIVLIKTTTLGVYAIVITTAVISTVINLIFHPLYAATCLGVSVKEFVSEIIRHIIACFVLALIFVGICRIYMPDSWISLILMAVALVIIGLVCQLFLLFNREERAKLIKTIMRK